MVNYNNVKWLLSLGLVVGCNGPFDPFEAVGHVGGGEAGSTGTWTQTGTGTSTGTGTTNTCTAKTDLVDFADKSSETHDWIGGDPAFPDDNPCGVQGAFYAFTDSGTDGILGNADDTLKSPKIAADGASASVCSNGKCCISGTTYLWTATVDGSPTYNEWGAGIGLSLNDSGTGESKLPYKGPAKGFTYTLSGELNGQELRLSYTQSPVDSFAPYKSFLSLGKVSVLFTDVVCPIWASTCEPPTSNPYDIQLQVVGGDTAGDFKVCIDSITPII